MGSAGGEGSLARQAGFGQDLVRVALVTALVLLVPLVAMQVTHDVAWGAADFGAAAVLLVVAGMACLRAARRLRRTGYRFTTVAALALVLLALLAVWAELAVGVAFGLGS